jgi:hypothetical protein
MNLILPSLPSFDRFLVPTVLAFYPLSIYHDLLRFHSGFPLDYRTSKAALGEVDPS